MLVYLSDLLIFLHSKVLISCQYLDSLHVTFNNTEEAYYRQDGSYCYKHEGIVHNYSWILFYVVIEQQLAQRLLLIIDSQHRLFVVQYCHVFYIVP